MAERFDFIVVGAGMAGASVAYQLSRDATVLVMEQEPQPGYHATGRSAAVFTEIYGNAVIRALTVASGPFFASPPEPFAEYPLWSARPLIMIARQDQMELLRGLHAAAVQLVPSLRLIGEEEVLALAPMLRRGYAAGGLLEPSSRDLDVHAIHGGFLRGARAGGVRIVPRSEVTGISRSQGGWVVDTPAGQHSGKVIINAAGAWADAVAEIAGVRPVGLVPRRRSAFTFSFDPPRPVEHWPTIIDISEEFYFKPDAGKLLGSPADETASPPCDAQPEEFDIAVAIDRIGKAADFTIRSVDSKWAGLRSFVADKTPVVGFDDSVGDFFWLAAQGGYGIQTAPALSRAAAALLQGHTIPADLERLGIAAPMLSPGRLRTGSP